MGRELTSFCGSNSELAIVPNATHNDPFYNPQSSYWGDIVTEFLIKGGA
jgi:hypothetical protein